MRLIEQMHLDGSIGEEDRSSEFAAEGTAAHEVRAMCLTLGLDAGDFVGQRITADGFTFEITDAMAGHLQPGIDWIRERAGPDLLVEQRISLDSWLPGNFGTLDTGFVHTISEFPHSDLPDYISILELVVSDLKYGAGVPVAAEGNRQLRIYALGYWDRLGRPPIDRVRIVIDQPRAGGHKEWVITLDELLAFGEEVRAAGLAVDQPNAPLVPSDKACRWCPVKSAEQGCPAINDRIQSMFDDEDGDNGLYEEPPVLPNQHLMTPARRGHIVKNLKAIRDWLTQLQANSYAAAEAGEPDPGLKLVAGAAGDRMWADEEKAKLCLEMARVPAFMPPKMISPAMAEAEMKPKKKGLKAQWEDLQQYVARGQSGKPLLVAIEDDRPALVSVDDKFDND